jgi:hypothetical protein
LWFDFTGHMRPFAPGRVFAQWKIAGMTLVQRMGGQSKKRTGFGQSGSAQTLDRKTVVLPAVTACIMSWPATCPCNNHSVRTPSLTL